MAIKINKFSSLKWYLNRNVWTAKLLGLKNARKNHEIARLIRNNLAKQLVPAFQHDSTPLFHHVQFETVSICNNDCSFCAMNVKLKNREYKEASQELINKIGNELENYSFSGMLSLFNNNEPLIDKRLPDIVEFFRKKVPRAYIKILTNGKLVNIDIIKKLAKAGIDYIGINNYCIDNKLIPPVERFVNDYSRFDIKDVKIEISIRNKNAILHNRAGTSPNATILKRSLDWFCKFPFEQININPWGDMTICCNDVLYKHKFGNILNDNVQIYKLWSSKNYRTIRKYLSEGKRSKIKICSVCNNPGTGMLGVNICYESIKPDNGICYLLRKNL